MNTSLFTTTTYFNESLEEKLEDLKTTQSLRLGMIAKEHGLENKPTTKHFMEIHVIYPIVSSIQEILDTNNKIHHPISSRAEGSALRTDGHEKLTTLKVRLRNAEHEQSLRNQERQMLKRDIKDGFFNEIRLIVSFLFGCTEFFLALSIFQSANINPFYGLLMSGTIGFASGWGVYLGADYIKKEQQYQRRQLKHRFVLFIGLCTCIALGSWRYFLYQEVIQINGQIALIESPVINSGALTAAPYMLVSFILFLVSLSFEMRYWVSEEQRRKYIAYKEKDIEVKKAKKTIENLIKEIDTLSLKISSSTTQIIKEQEYAFGFEQRILGLADFLLHHYQSTNIGYRQDSSCPSFFGEKYNWKFRLYFDQLFSTPKS